MSFTLNELKITIVGTHTESIESIKIYTQHSIDSLSKISQNHQHRHLAYRLGLPVKKGAQPPGGPRWQFTMVAVVRARSTCVHNKSVFVRIGLLSSTRALIASMMCGNGLKRMKINGECFCGIRCARLLWVFVR